MSNGTLRLAVKATRPENVISTFERIRGEWDADMQLNALYHAMMMEVGFNVEKLGGHPIVSFNEFAQVIKGGRG